MELGRFFRNNGIDLGSNYSSLVAFLESGTTPSAGYFYKEKSDRA